MFGKKLAELRIEKGLTQVQLASFLNVSSGAIAMYETERRKLDTDKLVTFCDFFDVSVDFLLGRTDVRKPSVSIIVLPEDQQSLLTIYEKLGERSKGQLQERAKILLEMESSPNYPAIPEPISFRTKKGSV